MIKIVEIVKTLVIPAIISVLFYILGRKTKELEQEKEKNEILNEYSNIDTIKVPKEDIYQEDKW